MSNPNDFIILGTDTDAGKTTLALLWLTAFPDYEYWKPVETGPSDSGRVAELVPHATIHAPLCGLKTPVAPPLAARLEGVAIPRGTEIAAARPTSTRPLLVETFGGPFSPLNEKELQIELIRELNLPCVLVTSSALGAIGRTVQALEALATKRITPLTVLVGPIDEYAREKVMPFGWSTHVFCLQPPVTWTPEGLRQAVAGQKDELAKLRRLVEPEIRRLTQSDFLERDGCFVWHPYTSLGDPEPPLVAVGAQDEFLHLADGRRVIDGISSWWTILHGHRYEPLMHAWREALESFDHVHFAGLTHPPAIRLASALLSTMDWSEDGRVFYSDNGSTTVEVALKMAYQFWCHHGQPQRTRFVGFEHGYHGDTFGAMAVGRDRLFFGRFEPLLFGADILPLSPERLDDHLTRQGVTTAAVILEPLIQGAGGMRVHSPETLQRIFEVTRRHDVLFIADEVMTGNRTGTMWAHEHANIAPDLVCAGKTLTGGVMPLAATLVSPRIVAAFATSDRTRTFFHGHSFTAHPPACAVACANLGLGGTEQKALEMERFWIAALQPLEGRAHVREVRVKGSIAAIEIDVAGGYLADIGPRLRQSCLEDGVLLRPLGNVLYAMPPLRTSQASLEKIAAAMTRAVKLVTGG